MMGILCRGYTKTDDRYYLSDDDFRDAFDFCRRYQDYKREYRELSLIGASSPNLSSFGSRGSGGGSGVEALALRLADASEKIEIIESAVRAASDERIVQELLLKSLRLNLPFSGIAYESVVSEASFYRLRRRVYYFVSQRLKQNRRS